MSQVVKLELPDGVYAALKHQIESLLVSPVSVNSPFPFSYNKILILVFKPSIIIQHCTFYLSLPKRQGESCET